MPNKLKKVFSSQENGYKGSIRFLDEEGSNNFREALRIVAEKGKTVTVTDPAKLNTSMKRGDVEYPLLTEVSTAQIVIGSSEKRVPIMVETKAGRKRVELKRRQVEQEVIIATASESIVFMEIRYNKDTLNITFTYRMQLKYAEQLKEVCEAIQIGIGIIDFFFYPTNNKDIATGIEQLSNMRKSFRKTAQFFERLTAIENELQLTFSPSSISSIEDYEYDINELFFLLVEKKAVRVSGKITPMENTGITFNPNATLPEVGSFFDLTFKGETTYSLYNQTIRIFTANLLFNAMVKEVITEEDSSQKILYGDTDGKPMYISCTGFKTEEEAITESGEIMNKKDFYTEALTVAEYVAQIGY